jgi:solute:Na+ symporter, SSS family
MALVITYGALAVFFAIVVVILQRSYVADRDFTDFAVAGRSFGGFYQAMAFLNTGLPGYVYLGTFGFIARAGVIGLSVSTLVASIAVFLMADRVWTWGAKHNLRTQPDLMALRFNSRGVRVVAALLGIFGLFPWMILGMQALGSVFYALALGHIGFTAAVVLGVAVMSLRQVWTIRMGMRGIVISDLFQGIVAYVAGSALIVGLIAWLCANGATFAAVPAARFEFPGPGSDKPLLYMSLVLLPFLSYLCWPDLFVRLYTASGVAAVKRSSAIMAPIGLVFIGSLGVLALLASTRPDVAANPDAGWFALAEAAGESVFGPSYGPFVLALAGVTVFAASMGNIDATVQAIGAQLANDVLGGLLGDSRGSQRKPLSERTLMVTTQMAMAAVTLVSAAIACLPLPAMFKIGLFAIQVMVQLSVPLYLGIFTRLGNAAGAIAGMLAGVATVCVLQYAWPVGIPWALGLTTGAVGLIANLAVFVIAGALVPRSREEEARLDALFAGTDATRTIKPIPAGRVGEA